MKSISFVISIFVFFLGSLAQAQEISSFQSCPASSLATSMPTEVVTNLTRQHIDGKADVLILVPTGAYKTRMARVNISVQAKIWKGFQDEFIQMYGEQLWNTLLGDLANVAVGGAGAIAFTAAQGTPVGWVADSVVIILLGSWVYSDYATFSELMSQKNYEGIGARLFQELNGLVMMTAGAGCGLMAVKKIPQLASLINAFKKVTVNPAPETASAGGSQSASKTMSRWDKVGDGRTLPSRPRETVLLDSYEHTIRGGSNPPKLFENGMEIRTGKLKSGSKTQVTSMFSRDADVRVALDSPSARAAQQVTVDALQEAVQGVEVLNVRFKPGSYPLVRPEIIIETSEGKPIVFDAGDSKATGSIWFEQRSAPPPVKGARWGEGTIQTHFDGSMTQRVPYMELPDGMKIESIRTDDFSPENIVHIIDFVDGSRLYLHMGSRPAPIYRIPYFTHYVH